MRDEGELVTGDAVVLELHHAKSASRAIGYGIDVLVQVVSLVGLGIVFATAGAPDDPALVGAIVVGVQLLVMVGYSAICETLTRGKTLGKLAMGLRVVRDDGGPIRMRHALIRALAGTFVDFGPFGAWSFVGFLVSLGSHDGKRVGDYLAGTVVIRERVPGQQSTAGGGGLAMPPGFEAWASQLDLSGLPDELALSARRYLGRFHELNGAARVRLGAQLADEVAERIGTPAPPGVYTWVYLSAVLAERRNRAYAGARQGDAPESGPAYAGQATQTAPGDSKAEDVPGPFVPPG